MHFNINDKKPKNIMHIKITPILKQISKKKSFGSLSQSFNYLVKYFKYPEYTTPAKKLRRNI